MAEITSRGLRAEKDKKWESVQIKAFSLWLNQTLEPKGLKVVDIEEDLKSGVTLCTFLESSSDKKFGKYNKTPALRVHKIENLSIALKHVQGDLGVKLVGIGPEDIADGSLKLTLGLLWSLFVKLRIDTISEGGKSALDGLLAWVKNMTEGYQHVNITSFKESFNDGMAFAALVHSMDNEAIDYSSLTPGETEKNLNHAMDCAEKKLGIPRLLEVEDIINGNIDERAMILYNSLFFHAWNADEEKRRIKGEKESIADELARLREENEEFQGKYNALVVDSGDKDKRIAELEEEVRFLRKANKEGNELRKALEQKLKVLQNLLDLNQATVNDGSRDISGAGADGAGADGAGDAAGDSHKSGLSDSLDSHLRGLESENDNLLSGQEAKNRYLSELEERRKKNLSEMDTLKEKVAIEIAKRKEQEAIISELRSTLKQLQGKEIAQNKARVGLDVLKNNLEEHLEDLYRWRELNLEDGGVSELENFDLGKVTEDLNTKSFDDQLRHLDGMLQEENRNINRIIKMQDDKDYLQDKILQAGWLLMKGRKDWRKRWFSLFGNTLSFYNDQTQEKLLGSVDVGEVSAIVRQQASTEDEKKLWPLKLTVGERKLILRSESKKERHSWFSVLTSKISLIKYMKYCEAEGARPDTRLIGILKTPSVPSIYFANRAVDTEFMASFSKGILGRDELEDITLMNSSLNDELVATLLPSISKLPQLKRLNFSKNKITGASSEAFGSSLTFKKLEDLDVSHNQLNDEFLAAIGPNLSKAAALNSLILDGNQFTVKGVESLVASVTGEEFSSNIPDLYLSNNKLGDEGAKALIPLFSKFTFKSVHLAANELTDDSVVALIEELKKTNTVEELDLSYNKITSVGAVALKGLMDSCVRLHTIKLSGNRDLILDQNAGALFTSSEFTFSDLTFNRS